MDVLLYKNFERKKLKLRKAKKNFRNADADVSADAETEIPK